MENQVPSLAVILLSEDLEKLHAGALVGSVAAMSGMSVNFFVTMNALKAFKKEVIANKDFQAGTVGNEILNKQVPLFYDMLKEGKENGDIHVYGCAMAMDVMGWEKEDMSDLFDDIIGVTKFLGMAQNAQLMTM
ncbi:DsrE/DsrF/DrsH-like family protein [Neobacillus sp. SM06]|uniref:DsrE/DsrF/DrsH-like family protein n=1 Tax=Neobacillus sp. SM06 TaxID=3422492 RepID=UPI003D2A3991